MGKRNRELSFLEGTVQNQITAAVKIVSAHLICQPKVNVICHAGTRFVKVWAVYFVGTLTYFVRAADAPGKTKAINAFCAPAQNQKRRYLPDCANRVDAVFAFTRKSAIMEVTIF